MKPSGDVAQQGVTEGLHQKQFKGNIEVKDYDEVSTDPNSSGSYILVTLCKTENPEVEIQTDNGKEETWQNKQFESDSRKIGDRQPPVSQPQAEHPKTLVIGRSSMPQIIQVTSFERSKTKDYRGQSERLGSRMQNGLTA